MTKRNDKKTVPELRFRGFTDPWEQRQLGEVAEVSTGGRNTQDGIDNGKYPFFVRSQEISSIDQFDYDETAILVPGDGRIGEIFHLYSGKYALHQRVYRVVPNQSRIVPNYLLALMQFRFRRHVLRLNAQGTVPSLRLPFFTGWEIPLPSLPEQHRIGDFFSTLDSLIAAAERQETLLRQKKQAYLQLMFPREAETEPRLRFAGFSGEWETRRFGEIFQYERPDAYLADDDEIEDEGAIPVLTANKAFILGYTNSLQGTYRKGRCVIFDDFTLDSKRVEQPFKVRSSAIKILTVRENKDFDFAFELLRTRKFPLLGHARHYITVVQPQAALIPHSLQEQQHIGRFFRNFDSLIAVAEKQTASLCTLKSAYLQRMFV